MALASALTLSACGGSADQAEPSAPVVEQEKASVVNEAVASPQLSTEELTEKARTRFEAALEAEAAKDRYAGAKMANIVTYYCATIESMLGKEELKADRIALMQITPSMYKKYWRALPESAPVMPYDFTMVATQYGCFYTPQ